MLVFYPETSQWHWLELVVQKLSQNHLQKIIAIVIDINHQLIYIIATRMRIPVIFKFENISILNKMKYINYINIEDTRPKYLRHSSDILYILTLTNLNLYNSNLFIIRIHFHSPPRRNILIYFLWFKFLCNSTN